MPPNSKGERQQTWGRAELMGPQYGPNRLWKEMPQLEHSESLPLFKKVPEPLFLRVLLKPPLIKV